MEVCSPPTPLHDCSPASISSDGIAAASGASKASGKVCGNAEAPAMTASGCRFAIALTMPAELLAEPLTLLQFILSIRLAVCPTLLCWFVTRVEPHLPENTFSDFFVDDELLEHLHILEKFLDKRCTNQKPISPSGRGRNIHR